MDKATSRRKIEHMRIALNHNVQARNATTGLEDVTLVHKALPEIDRQKISLSTTVFGHRFGLPIILGAITGGAPESTKINQTIAETAENLGIGMGVGSQRAAIEDKKLERTFAIARKKAPTAFLLANIGGVQLARGYGIREVRRAMEMIEADALAIHLNALQETAQPEGQTDFSGILGKIHEIAEELDKPVIVKETGAGISSEEAKDLVAVGVRGIDISGVGGTSFAAVEYYRSKKSVNDSQKNLGKVFWDWGIPTAVSIVEVSRTVNVPLIASGGIRDGLDAAKAMALGSHLVSLSQPILQAATKGIAQVCNVVSSISDELRSAMFLVGARSIRELHKTPTVIVGKTAEWLNARGFGIDEYARRKRVQYGN